jgi:hypothetical protein
MGTLVLSAAGGRDPIRSLPDAAYDATPFRLKRPR